MHLSIKKIAQAPSFNRILIGTGLILAALAIFSGGVLVGFHKANLSYRWGETYYRGIMGDPHRGIPMMPFRISPDDFSAGSGAVGTVVSIGSSSLIIEGKDNLEKTILINAKTLIARGREQLSVSDIKADDEVIILGTPNATGEIQAKLIRLLPPLNPLTQTSTPR